MSTNEHAGAGLLRASVGGRAAPLYMQLQFESWEGQSLAYTLCENQY
jgi:hypothetical protein